MCFGGGAVLPFMAHIAGPSALTIIVYTTGGWPMLVEEGATMSWLLAMHARLVFTIVLLFGTLTIWGLFRYLRGHAALGGYLAGLWIGELLLLSQALIGVALWIGGHVAVRQPIHTLYGVVAIITLPGTFAYVRGRDPRWAQLVYALACLFLCGIALRSLETGRLPGT